MSLMYVQSDKAIQVILFTLSDTLKSKLACKTSFTPLRNDNYDIHNMYVRIYYNSKALYNIYFSFAGL